MELRKDEDNTDDDAEDETEAETKVERNTIFDKNTLDVANQQLILDISYLIIKRICEICPYYKYEPGFRKLFPLNSFHNIEAYF